MVCPYQGGIAALYPDRTVTIAGHVQSAATAWLLLRASKDLHGLERRYLHLLRRACPDGWSTQALARAFGTLVRTRDHIALAAWLRAAELTAVPELASVAAGLRRHYDAVEAALRLAWSNGQTEGQIPRLKCLKRQLYGRAGVEAALRQRVLHPP
jgi:transposase